MYVYMCMHMYMIHVYIYIFTNMYVYTCVCMYITCIHTYMDIYVCLKQKNISIYISWGFGFSEPVSTSFRKVIISKGGP